MLLRSRSVRKPFCSARIAWGVAWCLRRHALETEDLLIRDDPYEKVAIAGERG